MTAPETVPWQVPQRRSIRFLPTIIVLTLLVAVAATALSGRAPCALSGGAAAPGSADSGANAPCATLPDSPLVGVVTSVDSAGLSDIRGFDLLLADGSTVTLKLGQLENATEFSPSHLTEHQATSVPIRAFYRLDENGSPVVYRLEDAST